MEAAPVLTPVKRQLMGALNCVMGRCNHLSAENLALRKRLGEEEAPDNSKKSKTLAKLNEKLGNYNLFDKISLGTLQLTLMGQHSIGERIGNEVFKQKASEKSAGQKAAEKQKVEKEIDNSFKILQAYVNRMYEIHDCSFNRNAHQDRQLQMEKENLAKLLHNLALHIVGNRAYKRDRLGDSYEQRNMTEHRRRRFKSRMDDFINLGCLLFKCAKAAHLVMFLIIWFKEQLLDVIKSLEFGSHFSYEFSTEDSLFVHFAAGQSFLTSQKFFQAIQYKSGKAIVFPGLKKIRETRESFPIGKIECFEAPSGKMKGRTWATADMIPRTLENEKVVQNMLFLGNSADDAEVILEFNIDGMTANFSNVLCCVSRWVGLGEISRNPSALHIHLLDESKEDCVIFEKFFRECVIPGLEKCYDAGKKQYFCHVRCLNQGSGGCKLCDRNVPAAEKESVDGVPLVMHKVLLSVIYCCDEKAFKLMLPIQPAICRRCNTNLRRKDSSFRTATKGKQHSLQDFLQADIQMRKAYEKFEDEKLRCAYISQKCSESMDLFYKDPSFKRISSKANNDDDEEKESEEYTFKSFMCDPITPLSNYLTDTLHFQIVLANLVLRSVILPLVEAIELLHPGCGVHAFYVACKLAGLRHIGNRLREYARSKFKTKIIRMGDYSTVQKNRPGISFERATKEECLKSVLPKWKLVHARKVLVRLLPKGDQIRVHSLSLPHVLKELKPLLQKTEFTKFKTFFDPHELQTVDNALTFKNIEAQVLPAGEQTIDLRAMSASAGVKFQGRDAQTLFLKGGGEKLIRHLCPFLQNLQIKNYEQLDSLIAQIDELDDETMHLKQHKKNIMKQLLLLKDIDADEIKKENFQEKVDSCFDVLIADNTDSDYQHLRHNIQRCGDQILDLFADSDGAMVELNDQTQHFMKIFLALKACVVPIIRPCSTDKGLLLNDMKGHDARVKAFEALLSTDEMVVSFGDKSDYMHWLKFHAKEECERVIKTWNLHLSKFSCQTSEHFNKVMKRLVEKLHGFTSRSVSKEAGKEWKNKFGYIMQQFQIRYFHFYDTFSSLNSAKCGRCKVQGHNVRTCEEYNL